MLPEHILRKPVYLIVFILLTILTEAPNHAVSQSTQTNSQKVFLPLVVQLPKSFTAEYQMPPRSQNPLLMRAIRSDGYIVDYFGSRNQEGIPTALESVSVLQEGNDLPVSITMEDERPRDIVTGDGSRFLITWVDETNIRITATTSNGKYQVSIPVDLENPEATLLLKGLDAESFKQREPCAEGDEKGSVSVQTADETQKINNKPSELVTISLSRCGQPYNSETPVRVQYQSDELGTVNYIANQTGTGIYAAEVPTYDPSDDTPIGDVCTDVVGALGITCTALTGLTPVGVGAICTAISGAVDVIAGGPTGEAIVIFGACQAGLNAALIYCETIGAGPAPGAPSLADIICEGVSQLELPSETITLTPYVFDPQEGQFGTWVYGDRLTFPATGPFSALQLNLVGETALEEFYTQPEDPSPLQGYIAYAHVLPCNNSEPVEVTISILGTDGYFDSITYTITEPSMLSLFIPGAEAGVRDQITVRIDGEVVRTISIIF